ncbi:MAG: DUF1707 domain-containing protein [Propioniciclava sp.]
MRVTDLGPAGMRVSDLDRDSATEVVQAAYSEGRINELELDERLSAAMQAVTRRDLTRSTSGLPMPVRVPPFVPGRPTYPNATPVGGLAHLSGMFTWIVGPLIFFAATPPGSPARREAAYAFNFQALVPTLMVVWGIVGGATGEVVFGMLAAITWLTWVTGTIVAAARAFTGQPSLLPKWLRSFPVNPDSS